MEIPKTDMLKILTYLSDAARLYEAIGTLPSQKCVSRAHMIRQMVSKIKSRMK